MFGCLDIGTFKGGSIIFSLLGIPLMMIGVYTPEQCSTPKISLTKTLSIIYVCNGL